MVIAGIDYSLTSPSICIFNSQEPFTFNRCAFYFLTDVKKNQRLFLTNIKGESITDWIVILHDMKTFQIGQWNI